MCRVGRMIDMKIALAQTCIEWENKQENYNIADEYAYVARKSGADIIFFPEMSFTGFSMNVQVTGEKNDQTVEKMREFAKKNSINIGFGWVHLSGEKATNHYSVVDSNGNLISDYCKIHPFSYGNESQYYEGGDKIVNYKLFGYNFSNFICYDLRFPEIFQIASKRSEIIVVPANWPKKREEHWKTLLKARAIENQCYILGVNCVGNMNGAEYSGCSMAVSPNGDILTTLENSMGIIYVKIEENVQDIRNSFPVKNDRKWELYNKLSMSSAKY